MKQQIDLFGFYLQFRYLELKTKKKKNHGFNEKSFYGLPKGTEKRGASC